jgi:anti-sigma regulatory factor (Ser/Thr protein kinase)
VLGMARRDFGSRVADVRAARLFAVGTATTWGVDPCDIEAVVGELAANAYQHARTPFTVSVCFVDQSVTVEVGDQSRELPVLSSNGPLDSGAGRGLRMVDAVSTSWGARLTPGGKIVWAEFPVAPLGS